MYPYRPGNFPTQMPMQRPMMQPFSRFPMQQMQQGFQQPRGFGNLLSRFLGKGRNAPANFGGFPSGGGFPGGGTFSRSGAFPGSLARGFSPGVGGQLMGGGGSGGAGLSGLMGNLTSGGIPEMLNNVQRVMGLAQQFGPMIQQYGPFIKNMPAMFKIMRELNSSDDSTDTENETTTEVVNESTANNQANTEAIVENEPPDFSGIKVVEPLENTVKPSKPKLYI